MKVITLIVKIVNLLEFTLLMKMFSNSGSLEYIYMFFFNPLYSWEWVQIENMIEMENTKGELKKINNEKKNRNFPKRWFCLSFWKLKTMKESGPVFSIMHIKFMKRMVYIWYNNSSKQWKWAKWSLSLLSPLSEQIR